MTAESDIVTTTRTRVALAMAVTVVFCFAIGFLVGERGGWIRGREVGMIEGSNAAMSAAPLHATCCEGTVGQGVCWAARQNGQCYAEDKPK